MSSRHHAQFVMEVLVLALVAALIATAIVWLLESEPITDSFDVEAPTTED